MFMKIKVILNLLLTICFVSCPRDERVILMGIKVFLKNVPMACDENMNWQKCRKLAA